MTKQEYADIIQSWALGHLIQYYDVYEYTWYSLKSHETPWFNKHIKYRVIPKVVH